MLATVTSTRRLTLKSGSFCVCGLSRNKLCKCLTRSAHRFYTCSCSCSVSAETSRNPLGTVSELRGWSDERTSLCKCPRTPSRKQIFVRHWIYLHSFPSAGKKGKFPFPITCVSCSHVGTQCSAHPRDFVNAVMNFRVTDMNYFDQLNNYYPLVKNDLVLWD
jgi:hypothetical protein